MVKVKISDWKADTSMDEAYKALRTNIQFCGADKKVIAFTSCTPNEGKSNVTFHLAASLAESGKSVLLIDADLRKSVTAEGITYRPVWSFRCPYQWKDSPDEQELFYIDGETGALIRDAFGW